MNTTSQNKTTLYETSINMLCERAKQCSSGYREGERDEHGHPYGVSPYALIAKLLWKFKQDNIKPVPSLETLDEFPTYYENVFHAFTSLYEVRPEIASVRNGGDFLSDYVLKE